MGWQNLRSPLPLDMQVTLAKGDRVVKPVRSRTNHYVEPDRTRRVVITWRALWDVLQGWPAQ